MVDSFTDILLGGMATFLAEQGLVEWDQYGEGAPYTLASMWPVYPGPDMPSTPDRVVVITPGVTSFIRADIMQTFQIRLRGSKGSPASEVHNQMQAIHDVFYPNGMPLSHVALGPVRVGAVFPADRLPLSADESRRHGVLQNFRIRARRPGPQLPPTGGYGTGGYGE